MYSNRERLPSVKIIQNALSGKSKAEKKRLLMELE